MFGEWKNKSDQSVKDKNQWKIDNMFRPDSEKYSTGNKRQQQLTNSIIQNLIISMGLPMSIVDHVSFKKFMNDVDPKYKCINHRNLTRSYLPILQKKCVVKLQEICAQSSYASLTLDVWSDRRMRSYFGIILHVIINDEYRSFLLSFEQLEGNHAGDKLAAEFDRVIQLYNLNNKIVRLITGNTNNNLAAFDNIVLPGFEDDFDVTTGDQSESDSNDELSDENAGGNAQQLHACEVDDSVYQATLKPTTEEEFLRLPCFCHSLQLVVNDGIKSSGQALSCLKKVASLAKFAHTSTLFAERLEKKNDLILNSRDRNILEEFVSLFELFNEATVLIRGESYATVSLVAPIVLGILFDLEHELNSSTLILVSLCKTLISSLKARFSGLLRQFEIDVPNSSYCTSERFSDAIFIISSLLDPRFKLLWLDNLDTVVKVRVLEKIRIAFVRFFSKLTFYTAHNAGADTSNATESTDVFVGTKDNDSSTKRITSDDKSEILMELDAYLCEESREEDLLFSKKHIYPRLYQLALKYLTVPATSAPIRRVFSQSGFLMRPHRASLTEKNVCVLSFLKCNKVLL
ncbi:unnamed protein product [Rotaria socialis]|uniref:HAT C-terminal dimerisation domain-containing protein n=1 Tax=Rotaria socialis TaxID=392032 RepID=A0A817P8P2_9BILA|nr:unnamed protein product [Rotaria socialis]CAF3586376.1 unnamed protein product [Rotaria socialis]